MVRGIDRSDIYVTIVHRRHKVSFDYMKATQALNYFALKEGGCISRLKALKLIYFADRYHLRKYGRFITDDIYFAMRLGPVASNTADIAGATDFMGKDESKYRSQFIAGKGKNDITSLDSPDLMVFSESDIEALEFAWDSFGCLDKWDASDITHDYPEWLKHKNKLDANPGGRFNMPPPDFLDDPVKDLDKCYELTASEKEIKRDQIEERQEIESFWV